MRRVCQIGSYLLTGALLAATAGCPGIDPRLTNQGGGSVVTVGTKLAAGNVGQLNADEWQILTDNAAALASRFGVDLGSLGCWPQLSDDEAAAIVQFLADNGVNTFDDLQQLFDKVASGQVKVPQTLVNLGAELAGQGCSI